MFRMKLPRLEGERGCVSSGAPLLLSWLNLCEKAILKNWPTGVDCQDRDSAGGNISVAISSVKLANHIWVNHNELYRTTHNSWEPLLRSSTSWEHSRRMKYGVKNPGKLQVTIPHGSGQFALSHTVPRHHLEVSSRWEISIHIMPVNRLQQDDVHPFYQRHRRSSSPERVKLGACCFFQHICIL